MKIIKLTHVRTTHQHWLGSTPFTLDVHSVAIVNYRGRVRVDVVGFGLTKEDAVADAVKQYREGIRTERPKGRCIHPCVG